MKTKKKKLLYDIAISLGLIFYVCLTTLIFINHKRIVQLKKQIENVAASNSSSNNTISKKQKNVPSQNKQKIEHLEKSINDMDIDGHFKLGVHFLSKTGSEKKAIAYFEKLLQIDPNNKNKKNIEQWLVTLKKRNKRNQLQLLTNLQNLTKFIKENPQHYSVGLKKKQIEIIKTQLERKHSK
ncbi:hypothetical protein [Candidatus Uabimicrobium sp. HlEnr_7]|uniref:hypothetical protein n=1 Tax=Candidatus Uabimicrobium helgolandensis TaxID=3095367 RepID=UPI003558226E